MSSNDSSRRMQRCTWSVKLWDDPNAAIPGIADYLGDIPRGVDVVRGEGAMLRQARQGVALIGEALIIDNVPVQHIHLHRGHGIQVLLSSTAKCLAAGYNACQLQLSI